MFHCWWFLQQYLFLQATTDLLVDLIIARGKCRVLCIGTPRWVNGSELFPLYDIIVLHWFLFLSLVSTLTRNIDIANLSVRPSVHYVLVFYENSLTYLLSVFHHTALQSFYFYQHQTSSRNSDGVAPCGGAKYRWGIKISRFWTNNSLYVANDTRYRHSYYRKLIGTRMRSVKWCHFQWPWTNPNPVFKVAPFFDAEYLTNGDGYGHRYCRTWIEYHTQAFGWHHFNDLEWPLSQISR